MLRLDLCDYSDSYFIMKETINLKTNGNNDMPRKDVVLKNNT